MTKLENGLQVKRLDNGMVGVLEHLGKTAWKIKYLDGTASYGSESKIKENFFIQNKEPETIEVKGYTVVDLPVESEQEEGVTYDEYLARQEGIEPPEKEFAEEYCKKDYDLSAKMYEVLSDGVEPETGLIDKQKHYTNNGIQPITIMKANMTKEKYRGFLEGNILKYPLRYEDKDGLKDLKKTLTYLTWLIEDIEERGL